MLSCLARCSTKIPFPDRENARDPCDRLYRDNSDGCRVGIAKPSASNPRSRQVCTVENRSGTRDHVHDERDVYDEDCVGKQD